MDTKAINTKATNNKAREAAEEYLAATGHPHTGEHANETAREYRALTTIRRHVDIPRNDTENVWVTHAEAKHAHTALSHIDPDSEASLAYKAAMEEIASHLPSEADTLRQLLESAKVVGGDVATFAARHADKLTASRKHREVLEELACEDGAPNTATLVRQLDVECNSRAVFQRRPMAK